MTPSRATHGPTGPNGHTSEQCKTLMAHAKQIKASYAENNGVKRVRVGTGKNGEEIDVLVDEHGNIRLGNKAAVPASAAKANKKTKKRGPSAQFERDLNNLEALSLSSDESVRSSSTTASDSS